MMTRREFLAVGSCAVGSVDPSLAMQMATLDLDAVSASRSVLNRFLGDRSAEFDLQQIPLDSGLEVYVLSCTGGRARIQGSSAVALCRGVYAYLREIGAVMVCWSGRRVSLPVRLPDRSERKVVSPYRFVQYYNVCTYGYTTAFWDWDRWERELDWMALHGINMPLAMEGQEAIWQRVWKSFGITQAELDRYFTGPAYLPWHRMGNIDYYEGPLPQGWIDQKCTLQKKIMDRMRELGMCPVVPAFAGSVPEAFKRIHPQARPRLHAPGPRPRAPLVVRDASAVEVADPSSR